MTAQGLPVLMGTGSREYEDRLTLWRHADRLLEDWACPLMVFHGAAKGFDDGLGRWAVRRRSVGVAVRPFPAEWGGPAGLGAGGERNQLMVDQLAGVEQRLALIGLHPGAQNFGTLNCAEKILTARIPFEAWWGATGLTPPRSVGREELMALIVEAKRAKEARRRTKQREDRAAKNAWMEALDV